MGTSIQFKLNNADVFPTCQAVQESAFEIVDDGGTLKLYWYGVQAECPYSIQLIDGYYKLFFNYTT